MIWDCGGFYRVMKNLPAKMMILHRLEGSHLLGDNPLASPSVIKKELTAYLIINFF